ncbi:MAG: ParA family protein [Chloroflexi bacterium]|nr:ParA family protein [Chloroflexota bacterium]
MDFAPEALIGGFVFPGAEQLCGLGVGKVSQERGQGQVRRQIVADALLEGRALAEVALASRVERLDLVPPGARLGQCSDQMGGTQGLGQGREFRIRRLLRGLTGYDWVVFDTSPVLTPLNVAILYAVHEVIIPIDPCVAALAGVQALEDLIRDVSIFRRELTDGGAVAVRGVLITRADRTLVSRQVEGEVRAYFGPLVFERTVPTSVKFREAYARGIPLVHYDPECAGAAAYRAAAAALDAATPAAEPLSQAG